MKDSKRTKAGKLTFLATSRWVVIPAVVPPNRSSALLNKQCHRALVYAASIELRILLLRLWPHCPDSGLRSQHPEDAVLEFLQADTLEFGVRCLQKDHTLKSTSSPPTPRRAG